MFIIIAIILVILVLACAAVYGISWLMSNDDASTYSDEDTL